MSGEQFKKKIYPLHYYDKDGYLKPPKVFYISIIYLLRGYIIVALASSYGTDTSALLGIFYPQITLLYMHLVIGLPALLAFLLLTARFTLREQQRLWPLKCIKPLLLIALLLDIVLHVYIAKLQYWQFDWVLGMQLLLSLFLIMFNLKKSFITH